MDRHFLDDCGLETHDSLSNELDMIRSEYFGLDLNNSSDSEGPDVTADETFRSKFSRFFDSRER